MLYVNREFLAHQTLSLLLLLHRLVERCLLNSAIRIRPVTCSWIAGLLATSSLSIMISGIAYIKGYHFALAQLIWEQAAI